MTAEMLERRLAAMLDPGTEFGRASNPPRKNASELALLHGPELVNEAFRSILKRDPNPEEYVRYLWVAERLGPPAFLVELASVPEARQSPPIAGLPQRVRRRSKWSLLFDWDRALQSLRLHASTWLDLLLLGLYRRVVSIERELSSVRTDHAALQRQVGDLAKKLYDDMDALAQRSEDTFTLLRQTVAHLPRTAVPVGDRLVVTRVHGYAMLMPAEDVLLASCLTIEGSVDAGMVAFLSRIVKPGMTFIDVGAHIGIHTIIAASRVGDKGTVYSFEPAPRTFGVLKTNVILNNLAHRVRLYEQAVSDTSGVARLLVTPTSGHNSLYGSEDQADAVLEVSTVALDETLAHVPSIDIVKIDAEGAEPAILRGMKQLIVKHPHMRLIIEFAPSLLERAGIAPAAFAGELKDMGFTPRRIDDISGELTPVSTEALLATFSSNLLLERTLSGIC